MSLDLTESATSVRVMRAALDQPAQLLQGWVAHAGVQTLEAARKSMADRLDAVRATFGLPGEDPRRHPWPCDPIPRLIDGADWASLERGLIQRVRALEAFIADLYGDAEILGERLVPPWVVATSPGFLRPLRGARPPGGVWAHIAGIDVLEDEPGSYIVIEDNLRVPSGAGYVLANRMSSAVTVPELAGRLEIQPVAEYPLRLRDALAACRGVEACRLAVLTPGRWNPAYFEHSVLAAGLGAEIVEGADLLADGRCIRLRGGEPVDVLYRRVDDAFCDPVSLRPDSLVGVPGLVAAWRAGQVVLANAPGTGVADDKAIFAFVPQMIRYYLGEHPLLPQAETYLPFRPADLVAIRSRLADLVLKPAWGSGGEGVVVGAELTAQERGALLATVERNPRAWVAQELIDFLRLPVVLPGGITEMRRADLRPFVVSHPGGHWVLPGGLTRIAPDAGYIVNSCQGGGSKDTWVCTTP